MSLQQDALAHASGLIDTADACTKDQDALKLRLQLAAQVIVNLVEELQSMKNSIESSGQHPIPAFLQKQAD
jgi:hypothetical protein